MALNAEVISEVHADAALPIRVIWDEFPTFGRYYRKDGLGFAVYSRSGQLLACMRCGQKMLVYRRRAPAYIPNEDGVLEFAGWVEQPNVVCTSENPDQFWLQHITCSTNAELEVFSEFDDSDSD